MPCRASLARLNPEQKANLVIRHYPGGHMFYTWEESCRQLSADMGEFYKRYSG